MIRLIPLLACSLLIPTTVLGDDQADALALIHSFVTSMNNGDFEAAVATCSDNMVIVDNVSPYQWHGRNACAEWAIALEADAIAKGRADIVFSLGEVRYFETGNGYAYAVNAASYSYSSSQSRGRVEGLLTTSLQQTASGWRMTGFAFAEQ